MNDYKIEILENLYSDIDNKICSIWGGYITKKNKQEWLSNDIEVIKLIWGDFINNGIIAEKYYKFIDKIITNIYDSIIQLSANSILVGHDQIDPIEFLNYNLYDNLDKKSKLYITEKKYNKFLNSGYIDYNAFSDYAIDPLQKNLIELLMESNYEKKIMIIDRIFNITHMRGDLSKFFLKNGKSDLDQLSSVN